ncbi:serine protease inhibitor [Arthrobacter sp. M4]|uniref:serine protease inhibitor n=1 Tax=Arthrobacter sp. M4 TaxID=218160 RepID=UPI001CDC301E|nr:serine protease inhibitor [Arthrobacter sp. M4]MCA4134316.1 serine protease inhibitor [Arthrobacter sp. M4]
MSSDVDLTVTLRESPGAPAVELVLRADGGRIDAASTVPDPQAALAAVERFGQEAFFPVPRPDRICTQQYGGPQRAVVTGTLHGRPVNAQFARTDGCEIALWQKMAPLLGGAQI